MPSWVSTPPAIVHTNGFGCQLVAKLTKVPSARNSPEPRLRLMSLVQASGGNLPYQPTTVPLSATPLPVEAGELTGSGVAPSDVAVLVLMFHSTACMVLVAVLTVLNVNWILPLQPVPYCPLGLM